MARYMRHGQIFIVRACVWPLPVRDYGFSCRYAAKEINFNWLPVIRESIFYFLMMSHRVCDDAMMMNITVVDYFFI